jgi:predicted alpha/beta-fold hydrolase
MLLASLDRPASPRAGTPLVVLIHGLTGSEDSLYVFTMTRLMLDRGSRVLRLNLRGAGPSRAVCGRTLCRTQPGHRALLSVLPGELKRDGLVAVGYRRAAMLLKYLGEAARHRRCLPPPVSLRHRPCRHLPVARCARATGSITIISRA